MEIISGPMLGQTPRETDDLFATALGLRGTGGLAPAPQPENASLAWDCSLCKRKVPCPPSRNTRYTIVGFSIVCLFVSTLNEDLAFVLKNNTC